MYRPRTLEAAGSFPPRTRAKAKTWFAPSRKNNQLDVFALVPDMGGNGRLGGGDRDR
jgi:hypothetical protein